MECTTTIFLAFRVKPWPKDETFPSIYTLKVCSTVFQAHLDQMLNLLWCFQTMAWYTTLFHPTNQPWWSKIMPANHSVSYAQLSTMFLFHCSCPIKKAANSGNTNYFDCKLQTSNDESVHLVCYSPKKRESLQQVFASQSPVKIVGTKKSSKKTLQCGYWGSLHI